MTIQDKEIAEQNLFIISDFWIFWQSGGNYYFLGEKKYRNLMRNQLYNFSWLNCNIFHKILAVVINLQFFKEI